MGCVSLRASAGETSPTSGKIRAITSDLKCDCLWFPDRMLLPSSNWLCSGNNHGGFQEIIGTRCRINFLFLRRVDRDYIESQQTAPQSQCDLLGRLVWKRWKTVQKWLSSFQSKQLELSNGQLLIDTSRGVMYDVTFNHCDVIMYLILCNFHLKCSIAQRVSE